jgi:dihydroorotate dehydrogenase
MVDGVAVTPATPPPADLAYRWARPWLFRQDAEVAHDRTLKWAEWAARTPWACGAAHAWYGASSAPQLAVEALGLTFSNPIGLAAGLDKNGVAIDLWAALGFGFVEVGTVTPGEGQPGNPSPRVARLVEQGALVNRMGFNNAGSPALARRLAGRRTTIPVGVNVGKAKVTPLGAAADDYEITVRDVYDGASYLVLNVSSPNTPGLRDLQSIAALRPLLERVVSVRDALAPERGRRPVLLKIAPDLADEDVDAIADLVGETKLDGVVATNTTIRAPDGVELPFSGGVSGAPLTARANALCRRLFRRLGPAVPIIGVGGISNAEDAYARIRAGAQLLQIYTAFVYRGPGLVRDITEGLARRLDRDGFRALADAVGADG